jgi:integrase
LDTNHSGEVFDFHGLRHTCGAWLALTGAHPKVVQTVMRHSTITLTMDTYGHLFPGQEAEAIGRLQGLLAGNSPQQNAKSVSCLDSSRGRHAAAG